MVRESKLVSVFEDAKHPGSCGNVRTYSAEICVSEYGPLSARISLQMHPPVKLRQPVEIQLYTLEYVCVEY